MSLIPNITVLRNYVKMAFTATTVKAMPDIDAAERKFLIPVLTQSVYDALLAQIGGTVTWNTLLNLCRATIAPLAVYLDLPFMQASIEDGGIKTTHSDNKEAAHQWEYNEIKEALINKGLAALDDLIEHLLLSGSTYSWNNPAAKESIFRSGKDFSSYVHLHQPNVTFLQLRPLVAEVEDHFIKSEIGDDFFAELRDKASPSAYESAAIRYIKKAVANYTIARAVERLPVKITPYGLMATLENVTAKPADNAALERLLYSSRSEGEDYLQALMDHLNKYASDTVFGAYFSSDYYTAPVAASDYDPNDCRRGIVAM